MGESGLNMNYEFNVLGAATNLKLKGGREFPEIKDEPVEKQEIEKEKNFFERFIENLNPLGMAVSAVFGLIGIGAGIIALPLEGVAAVVAGVIAIGAGMGGNTRNYVYSRFKRYHYRGKNRG